MLRYAAAAPAASAARLMRFDFHPTPAGWRLSEANTDVPGGLNEASGWTALMAEAAPGHVSPGDVAGRLVRALLGPEPVAGPAALLHATSFSDDRQVMAYLARRLEASGAMALPCSPSHLEWRGGRACLGGPWKGSPVHRIVRFFPAEWLPDLPASSGWRRLLAGALTPACNPGHAVLTQTKRFPLVWDALGVPLPVWRAVLPETRAAGAVDFRRNDGWVLKPALGRVGEDVCVPGVTPAAQWSKALRSVRRHERVWVAQRRFESSPVELEGVRMHVCLGVFTVDTEVAGVYGRVSATPVIDWRAQDVAVLVEPGASGWSGQDGAVRPAPAENWSVRE